VAGIIAGVYAGNCCGIMGAMEGVMAGFMGGTMGAMLTVMMVIDHPIAFLVITMLVSAGTLVGIMRVVANEHAGATPHISPWPAWLVLLGAGAASVTLSVIMLLLPRGVY
jgi:hypothetical protein